MSPFYYFFQADAAMAKITPKKGGFLTDGRRRAAF